MRNLIIAGITLFAAWAFAQTCIPGGVAPSTPPVAQQATITFPADGGTVGCTFTAFCSGCAGKQNSYVVGNAKCATMVQMATQATANDNGWNDGGAP